MLLFLSCQNEPPGIIRTSWRRRFIGGKTNLACICMSAFPTASDVRASETGLLDEITLLLCFEFWIVRVINTVVVSKFGTARA